MKKFTAIYFLLFSAACLAQTNQQWGSYFSYTNVVDLAQSSTRVYSAAESAIFSQNTLSGELKTITSVDGLKADNITCMYHSPTYNRTLVGNSNGLLLVINGDNSVVSKIDIIQETTVVATKKKINHIYEHEGLAYLSCDFGIAVFNLATLQFGDTYYLGPNGAEISVRQTTVYNGYLYAATYDNFGIRRGLLTNPNLNDYTQWEQQYGGYWHGVLTFNNQLFAITASADTSTCIRLNDNGSVNFVFDLPLPAVDFRESGGYFIATCSSKVVVYNEQLAQTLQINLIPNENVTFTCATVVNQRLYIGTAERGVFSIPINLAGGFVNITPNGPLRNAIFSLKKAVSGLWAVFGGYNSNFEPDEKQYGISKYTAQGWVNTPYEDIAVFGPVKSISHISVNPTNQTQVYFNSFSSGLLKVEEDVPVALYGITTPNTPFENVQNPPPNYVSVRINGGTFDSAGNLWMTNGRAKKPLKVLKAGGGWGEYTFDGVVASTKDTEYGKMAIDRNGTKWIPTYNTGLVAYNETLGPKYMVITMANGNLPVDYVRCVEIDNNNRLWIGTDRGLRVISSTERFTTEETLETTNIVFLENGEATELMYEQVITDIKTDGANNKWMGTGGAGAFLVSPDGQSTLFHFTKENSPLPSNVILDIEIDNATGEVFFATDKGMVSYKGSSTEGADDLSKVYVFPNPVRPGFEGEVNISGLVDNANVKITDIEGNLVYETTSEGGTVLWDTRAFGKYKVASGVYMIFISSDDATLTKVKKVMIVR